jgi:hypothetical protein
MVQEDRLDPAAMRAFLESHGVFPVGSWVRLTDGRTARVVDSRGAEYDRPVVTAVGGEGGERTEPEILDMGLGSGPKIAEALDSGGKGFDFAAGFHVEAPGSPAEEGEGAGAPSGGPAPEGPVPPGEARLSADAQTGAQAGRPVPPKYLDWSASFSGFLSDFAVLDLVQILDVSQKSGVLVLRFPEAQGEIKLCDGEIMSAELALSDGSVLSDEEAVFAMMEEREGRFRFEQGAVERRKSVRSNNTMILMEGCRRLDERRAEGRSGAKG